MITLQDRRDFYAQFIVRSTGSTNAALIDAFARTPREHYMGPGPWQIFVGLKCPVNGVPIGGVVPFERKKRGYCCT